MKTIFKDDELEELTIEDSIKSQDNGLVISPQRGERGENLSELRKEIIGHDANAIGQKEAARIHGVSESSVQRYANGEAMNPEASARVLDIKNGIRDIATTKLLQTLNLLDPTDVETKDLPRVAGQLSQIVERLEAKDKGKGNTVELHLYAPQQKKIANYTIIDV